MKRLTLLSFVCFLIIMAITAMNHSPDKSSGYDNCQLNAQCEQPKGCSANAETCKIDDNKSCCSAKAKSTCKSDCTKQNCPKLGKKKCGSNCSKPCCSAKAKSTCKSDCTKQCCSKKDKKQCGPNCTKPCCLKA